jgi:hypothetical protein
MQYLGEDSKKHNGTVNGRGAKRLKLTPQGQIELATDLASGVVLLRPTLKQAAAAIGVPVAQVRERLKQRAEARKAELDAASFQSDIDFLVEAWSVATPEARAEALQRIGPANVWDVLSSVVA